MDLWSEASIDHEAEADGRRFIAAKVVTSDWWPYLAGAETRAEFGHRLALIQDRLDSAVAATLPEDAEPREVLALSARVCGSLTDDWSASRRATLVEALRIEAAEREVPAEQVMGNARIVMPDGVANVVGNASTKQDGTGKTVVRIPVEVKGRRVYYDVEPGSKVTVQGLRKGAPFADYSDFKDCVSKNSDKDDPEAYCGKIKHQTEDSKTSRLASLFVLSERDQAAFEAEIAKSATPVLMHPHHLMHEAPDPWGSAVPDSSVPGNSAVEHIKDPAPTPAPGHDESSFWDKLKTHLVGQPHDPFALHSSKTAGEIGGPSQQPAKPSMDAPGWYIKGPEGYTGPFDSQEAAQKDVDEWGDIAKERGETVVHKDAAKIAGDVPPQFLEQQKKKSDDKDDSDTKDDKGTDDSGPGSAKWKEQQDGTNGDSTSDPDDDGKAEDGSSNSAQKDDDSDGDDDKKSDGPPPWVKNKQSAKTADLLAPGQADRVVNWLAHGGPPPKDEDLESIRKMYEQERGKQSALRAEADNEAPYRIQGDGPYKVVNSNGDVKGTHDTRDEALAQQRALYANVPGAREKAEADEKKKSSLTVLAADDLDAAIETAKQHIPIKQQVSTSPVGFTVVRNNDGSHHVYDADAWEKPQEAGILPWSAPSGVPVARVDLDGTVTHLGSLDSLLARSASLVTALGEQFTSDNPFTPPGGDMGGAGSGNLPDTTQPGGTQPGFGNGGGAGTMSMSSPPEARPWQDAGAAAPQADMSATPNTADSTTQDTDVLQRGAVRTASVDKVARITAGVLATNPGMDPALARSIAEETVLRYPGSQKD